MSSHEQKRLKKLQEDSDKNPNDGVSEALTYPDLIFLLKEDKKIRKLINKIVGADLEVEIPAPQINAEEIVEPLPKKGSYGVDLLTLKEEKPKVTDTLRNDLGHELALLRQISADKDLSGEWLIGDQEPEGRQLARIIAIAAQWEQILHLWDRLADRCKDQVRPANSSEILILQSSLAIHNLIWQGKNARLMSVEPGETYDYRKHERGKPNGDIVRIEWLPGLVSAGGQIQKKPLVET
jgi:hypothetical protein